MSGTLELLAAPGQVNGVAATTDFFRLTGVVVLPGIEAPTAAQSPLIMRPYDQELMTCKRYYQKIINPPGTAIGNGRLRFYYWSFPFPVEMRATPTDSMSTTISFGGAAGNHYGYRHPQQPLHLSNVASQHDHERGRTDSAGKCAIFRYYIRRREALMADYQLTQPKNRAASSAPRTARASRPTRPTATMRNTSSGRTKATSLIPTSSRSRRRHQSLRSEDEVLFDHENRIRAIEGQPPLDLGEFAKKLSG